jgi:hypothetical protein
MNFYARLFVVFIIVILLAEIMPEAVNAVLLLVLAGIILGHYTAFAGIGALIQKIGD